MRALICVAAMFAFVAPPAAEESDEPWDIHGRVVDEQGKPVDNFEAAPFWSSNGKYWDEKGEQIKVESAAEAEKMWKDEGLLAVNPRALATRASGGRFSLTIPGFPNRAVFVTDVEHRRGGLVAVQRGDRAHEVTVTLRPLVRVHGKIYCPDAGRTPDWTAVKVHAVADHDNYLGFILCGSYKGEFSFLLPPGKYDFAVHSQSPDASMPRPKNPPADMPKDLEGLRVEVPAGKQSLDLGVLFVEFGEGKGGVPRGDYSKHYGKAPPALQITDACGVDKKVKLSDYRGKWVLLDFWTLGCGPCIERSLPRLTKFYEEHAADRDRFEILAICVTDYEQATTKAEYEKLVAPIVENTWKGKPLPFPVLIDGEGKTLAAYGIQGVPSTLLIDPDGNLVKFGDEALLDEKLKEKRP
ncbi:MAG TPA: TlpA disulfide reductase family protein [Pirellulales bacterium]|jgi:thiol-disulfide isomerase/thioredoxin